MRRRTDARQRHDLVVGVHDTVAAQHLAWIPVYEHHVAAVGTRTEILVAPDDLVRAAERQVVVLERHGITRAGQLDHLR